jgi:Tol biopolymer transport system component
MAFSPDGNPLVFSGSRGTGADIRIQLYKRALEQSEAAPITGAEDGVGPFFSPDGKWIGFWAGGKLKKISMSGGPAVNLFDLGHQSWGTTWGSNDRIVFADIPGLMQVSAAGGMPTVLVQLDRAKNENFASPEFLPDGRTLLFTARKSLNWDEAQIVVRRPDGGAPRVLLKGGTKARYFRTGHLLYMNNAVLMAVPFDLRTLECTGPPVALLDDVMEAINMPNTDAESGVGQFAVSHSGNLVYALGGAFPASSSTVMRIDRKGASTDLNLPKGNDTALRFSPDGQRLAVTRKAGTNRLSDIWTYDLSRGTASPVTTGGQNSWPLWTRDGKRILFFSALGGRKILSISADGQGPIEAQIAGQGGLAPGSWSPDGKWLAYTESHQIWIRSASGQGEPKLFLGAKFAIFDPEFSPDGKWMAYTSDESGTFEVYAQAFPGPGEKVRISTDGGVNPAWARNGRELFYLSAWARNGREPSYLSGNSQSMMAVDIAAGNPLQLGTPRKLFELSRHVGCFPLRCYDVYPDAQSFVMVRFDPLPDLRAARLNVVLNWFDEVQRRAPRSGRPGQP